MFFAIRLYLLIAKIMWQYATLNISMLMGCGHAFTVFNNDGGRKR